LVWSGFVTNAALTNLWDISSTTNWLLGATPTTYRQPIIPGDAVTFNDSGSGTVVLNINAGPASLVISNNSKSYTFRGIGTVSGPGGLTKLGSGTAILNLTNSAYTGRCRWAARPRYRRPPIWSWVPAAHWNWPACLNR
jgi:hypothetical protein